MQIRHIALLLAVVSLRAQPTPEARNVTLVSHNDLGGNGDGGEGMVIQQFPGGRRILYLAHEGQKTCLSILDVTRPESPVLLNQLPSPSPGMTRCNSIGLSGTVLAVANQTLEFAQKTAGMWTLDVSDIERVIKAKKLEDLKLSFFDTSGPHSRGVHNLWFVDGEFAHITTGTADFDPVNQLDYQFYMTVDLRNPKAPREVARWWYPGQRKGDPCLPDCALPRHPQWDAGYRPHQTEVFPEQPDRLYLSYIEGGAFIMDISGLADVKAGRAQSYTPRPLGHMNTSPPFTGFTHTFQPTFNRGIAFLSDEDNQDGCKAAPRLVWLMDIRSEKNPMVIGTAPLHPNDGDLCKRGGRFGAHNIQPNFPGPTSLRLKNTAVTTWFNGGVRIFRAVEGPVGVPNAPAHIEEIGYYIPAGPEKNPGKVVQVNHAIIDNNGLIYATDRISGGLYILKYTGTVPLD